MRKKKQVNKLITSVIFSLVAFSALSQDNSGRPTLVVGITIDQLRNDYIELLQSHFRENGFKRLMNNGVYFENASFDISQLDKISATALIYSGTTPNVNGIVGSTVYDHKANKAIPIYLDSKYIGNSTDETYSPMALKVSTISDEIRMDNNGIGYVFSIAPDAQQAITMAGHAANGAFWINDKNGKWSSSTFYKDFPGVFIKGNFNKSLAQRIDTMSWTPIMGIEKYHDLPLHRTFYPFKYTFHGEDKYKKFKSSALINTEVTSVALSCIDELRLGRRATIDMLNISYTVAPYPYAIDSDDRIEIQDQYIRLDQELSRLFTSIDKAVGKNALIFVVSTGYFDNLYATEPRFNIPTGEFSSKKAISLLNMYLMAIYGNGNWVNGYFNEQIYLNTALAKEKNISIEELRIKSGDFLRRMSGVNGAYTFDEILNNSNNTELIKLNKSINKQNAGDIYLNIAPGWTIVDDFNNKNVPSKKQVRYNSITTPMFIVAPDIKAQRITYPVNVSTLAPTVTSILRIRSPNAANLQPLIVK